MKAIARRLPASRRRPLEFVLPLWKALPGGIQVTIPLRLVTLENQREHWRDKHKRSQQHRTLTSSAIWSATHKTGVVLPKPSHGEPTRVTLTRSGPRRLDPGNLEASFKHVQDQVAECLAVNDGNRIVSWRYQQVTGPYGVTIRIEKEPGK